MSQALEQDAVWFPDVARPPDNLDPALGRLVESIIGKVADKWTMLLLEALEQGGTMRFTAIGRAVPGISQKMLTKTLRQMEFDGLVTRTIHPVIPPHVDYRLTPLGHSLSAAFCLVWVWADKNRQVIEKARAAYLEREGHDPA